MTAKSKIKSWAEELFHGAWQVECPDARLQPFREYRFHDVRGWLIDFAWPQFMIAVEIDGQGRHQTISGQREDFEKGNAAAALGWSVFHFLACDRNDAAAWAAFVAGVMAERMYANTCESTNGNQLSMAPVASVARDPVVQRGGTDGQPSVVPGDRDGT